MTIQERQQAASNWADAYADWQAADEMAHHYDKLRNDAHVRLMAARDRLERAAAVGPLIPVRVFELLREVGSDARRLVMVKYGPVQTHVELLKTEPNE